MSPTKSRRAIRIAVYAMLVFSAGTAFLLGDRLWAAARVGDLPLWAPLIAPCAFTAFVVVYTADRWLLIRRQRYSPARAIFQVAFACVFLSLLWPHQAAELQAARRATPSIANPGLGLLTHDEPEVRAAACELMGLRGDVEALEFVRTQASEDYDEHVRAACSKAVARLSAAPPPLPATAPDSLKAGDPLPSPTPEKTPPGLPD